MRQLAVWEEDKIMNISLSVIAKSKDMALTILTIGFIYPYERNDMKVLLRLEEEEEQDKKDDYS